MSNQATRKYTISSYNKVLEALIDELTVIELSKILFVSSQILNARLKILLLNGHVTRYSSNGGRRYFVYKAIRQNITTDDLKVFDEANRLVKIKSKTMPDQNWNPLPFEIQSKFIAEKAKVINFETLAKGLKETSKELRKENRNKHVGVNIGTSMAMF